MSNMSLYVYITEISEISNYNIWLCYCRFYVCHGFKLVCGKEYIGVRGNIIFYHYGKTGLELFSLPSYTVTSEIVSSFSLETERFISSSKVGKTQRILNFSFIVSLPVIMRILCEGQTVQSFLPVRG